MNLPTVAIAECATCGAVSAEFGAVWGAAQYFKGGLVSYDTEAKIKHLGLERETAESFIDNPERVVQEMAAGVANMFDAQIGIATSGFATPFPPKGITTPYIWYCIRDTKTGYQEIDCVRNVEYLSRSKFQKRLGMILHNKYMILAGNY